MFGILNSGSLLPAIGARLLKGRTSVSWSWSPSAASLGPQSAIAALPRTLRDRVATGVTAARLNADSHGLFLLFRTITAHAASRAA